MEQAMRLRGDNLELERDEVAQLLGMLELACGRLVFPPAIAGTLVGILERWPELRHRCPRLTTWAYREDARR
jgi:hypothetical protein